MDTPDQQPRTRRIELILQQVDALPTLSPIAARLLEVSSPEDADLDAIVEIIESDPAMTGRVLGLCRRADKGLGDRITSVRHAVVMLGLEAIQSVVLSVSVYETLSHDPGGADEPGHTPLVLDGGPEPRFDRVEFWRYCVGVAVSAEQIARAQPALGIKPEQAFVAGLLCDLGKLALELAVPRTYARVVGLAERRRIPCSTVERELLGLDHHTAGKRLAEHWSLPHALQDVMWLHGQPAASLPDLPHRNLIALVGLAVALCRRLHLGWSGDFGPPERVAELCRAMGADPVRVEQAAPTVHDGVAHRCAVLGLDNTTTPELLLRSIAGANQRLSRLNAALEHRSRASQRQARVLAAITAFHAAWQPARSVVDTFAEVVRSAAALLGPGFYAVAYQPRSSDAWQLCQFAPDGRVIRSQLMDAPAGVPKQSLASLADPSRLSMSALALLPWLSDYLGDATDLRRVQLVPLALGPSGPRTDSGPGAVLLHDRDAADWPMDRSVIEPLTATWAAAVVAAAQHEGARRLGERVAESNRTLAEMQTRLSEAQSMARLGEMAAGAAHEMNNPLTVISGRSQLLTQAAQGQTERAAAAAIAQAAGQLSDLITSLRLLADPPTPAAARVRLADIVRAAADRAAERTGAGRQRVRIDTAEPSPDAEVDRELLAQAIGEVIANALEASPDSAVDVRVQTDPLDGRLLIVVKDKGPGMSAKALAHAFDPFFSEKPAGRQTGLGLTRARRLVELHGGEIALSSTPGDGTTATITLPGPRPLTKAA